MGTVKSVITSACRPVVLAALLPLAAAGATWSDTPAVEELSALLENGRDAEFLASHATALAQAQRCLGSDPADAEQRRRMRDAAMSGLDCHDEAVFGFLWEDPIPDRSFIGLREDLGVRHVELLLDYVAQCLEPESEEIRARCAAHGHLWLDVLRDAEIALSPEERARLRPKAKKCAGLFAAHRVRDCDWSLPALRGIPFGARGSEEFRTRWRAGIRQSLENRYRDEEQRRLAEAEDAFLAVLARLAEP